jgi:hypothetical protein
LTRAYRPPAPTDIYQTEFLWSLLHLDDSAKSIRCVKAKRNWTMRRLTPAHHRLPQPVFLLRLWNLGPLSTNMTRPSTHTFAASSTWRAWAWETWPGTAWPSSRRRSTSCRSVYACICVRASVSPSAHPFIPRRTRQVPSFTALTHHGTPLPCLPSPGSNTTQSAARSSLSSTHLRGSPSCGGSVSVVGSLIAACWRCGVSVISYAERQSNVPSSCVFADRTAHGERDNAAEDQNS